MSATILWFRLDLRLQDNPALRAAVERGKPVVPLYIRDGEGEGRWGAGAASKWWLHHSLAALDDALRKRGSRLILAQGKAEVVLRTLAHDLDADAVYWNRRYEPAARATAMQVTETLGSAGIAAHEFNATLLHEPEAIANKQGRPFQVFTPFWRTCLAVPVERPKPLTATRWKAPRQWPKSLKIADLGLRPSVAWDAGLAETWTPGEVGAAKRLRTFSARALTAYDQHRNSPGVSGTSMLSPHLHFGEITARQVWAAVRSKARRSGVFPPSRGAGIFLKEIGWREFAYHLLFHFDQTPERPLREAFDKFSWRDDPGDEKLRAWQHGQTGYPIVDAGLRQLWHTGWMHNRVRMVVGSFLVKHLRLSWQKGAAWFWDTLVDADLANNTLGWQWVAGCGADAAPYFRVFAPVLQGRKFDASGSYVRRWVPEIARLPERFLHAPWEAPPAILNAAGVVLGGNYPPPIVDHDTARKDALAAFRAMRNKV